MVFIKNLLAFIVGVACQVLAGLYPDLMTVFSPAATLLLGASNIGKVLNGSLWKHSTVFVLGVLCQVAAVKVAWVCGMLHAGTASVDAVRGAFLVAAGTLGQACDIARIISGIRTPAGTPDSPAPPVPPKP